MLEEFRDSYNEYNYSGDYSAIELFCAFSFLGGLFCDCTSADYETGESATKPTT